MGDNQHELARVTWRKDNIPVSEHFDDPYFSDQNGLAETQHVYLGGNNLPTRFCAGFHIAELGFGTGLNMLAAWHAWRQSGLKTALGFTSFEVSPMATPDMARALAQFPELAPLTHVFLQRWKAGIRRFNLGSITAEIIIGDARNTLPHWGGTADAWFLDGFSPAKNPQLWQPDLMTEIARHTRAGGTFATYTAAGHIRRSLSDAGFKTERRTGFGRKRHMTVGCLEPS